MTDSPVPLATHHHPDLSIDQRLALRTAATRLHSEFGEHFGVETIQRFLHSSYDQFAGRATIPNFLPLLAERWARQRLTALARVEGKITDAKPTVLFLCTHNAGRSQMALGYFNHLAGDQGVAWSGGSEPGNEINPAAVAAMAEVGIDITREFPKPWTDEIVQAADVVVTMGCGDACPVFPGNATRNGFCPTPPDNPSTRSARFATTSKNASAACSPNSTSPPPTSWSLDDRSDAVRPVRLRQERRQVADGRRADAQDRWRHRAGVLGWHQAGRRRQRPVRSGQPRREIRNWNVVGR